MNTAIEHLILAALQCVVVRLLCLFDMCYCGLCVVLHDLHDFVSLQERSLAIQSKYRGAENYFISAV